jgi:hypothetical protein
MEILDMGARGTSRWIRMVLLKGASQVAMGRECRPKLPQASISQFDRAETRMTWQMARRLAPAYAAEKAAQDLEEGARDVWQIWFVNVEAYGTPDMKRQAKAIRDAFGFDLPIFASAHAHAPAAVEQLGIGSQGLPAQKAVTA